MSEIPPEDTFTVTHETKLLDFQEGKLCCIIDSDIETMQICEEFINDGFDYNLKGIILRKSDGHQMGCRFILKGDKHFRDYKCTPSNEWISELRKSRRLGVADSAGMTMIICDDLWTGDIENVLKMFYSADQGQ